MTTILANCEHCGGQVVHVLQVSPADDPYICIQCGRTPNPVEPLPLVPESLFKVPVSRRVLEVRRTKDDVERELAERNARILSLRKKGLPVAEIARAYGISARTVHRAIQDVAA